MDDAECHLLHLSPEGFASILWKDGKRAPEAAEVMKLTAGDLKELGIVEEIVGRPGEFTVDTMQWCVKN